MQTENLFQPFAIEFKTTDDCPVKPHKHTFFELVYILDGKGIHHINQNKFPYEPGNLFLLMPMDMHHFNVTTTTSFLFIRFNNVYLNSQKSSDKGQLGEWIQKLEYIFQNSSHPEGCILRNPLDRPLTKAVLDAIMLELKNEQTLHQELLQQLVNTLITIVARNISLIVRDTMPAATQQHMSMEMLHYIHRYIYEPEKLKAEAMAAHFNISLNYISEYFKKHTNETLQQYIINYKLSLVTVRLAHSDMRLNEIAWELGFTDESHLTKTFKKYKGMSPAAYRKNLPAIAS
ncbi:AraC family transcriptional regulator [Chitinophaga solisilvae]|uniref:AraC family transcriptional regulator n=1 Tax=Chitinophaga solisilvae TaxID=1233460 RepID=UPI001370B7F8|nr:helix-turn-helix domain-containing protein [Chitinophaga solisilvae]